MYRRMRLPLAWHAGGALVVCSQIVVVLKLRRIPAVMQLFSASPLFSWPGDSTTSKFESMS